jgi:putative Mg2+ transporter-C (MgtC) family protein
MEDFLRAIGMADTFWQLPTILIRLVVAVIFGGIIGFEREASDHSAGLRTHILIALAAALYTVLTLEIFHLPEVMTQGRSDPVHSVEAVTAGIAFLGAGAIFRSTSRPHGLTTAAGMWLAGAVGMTAALGYYAIGLFVCVLALVVLALLKIIDRAMAKGQARPAEDRADKS